MFFQPPDEEKPAQSFVNTRSSRKKRKRNLAKQNNFKKGIFKKKNKLFSAMSTWAEQFTVASTWQIKHQLAYWKSRAKSLEYENKLLHDIIRKNCVGSDCNEDFDSQDVNQQNAGSTSETENDSNDSDQDMNHCEDNTDFEVSEEYIEFLRANAKFKEEARLEKERLKALNDERNDVKDLEAGPSEPRKSKHEELKALYGDNWQRIAALEMYVQCEFISKCDQDKPSYWPNIPFNFS